MTQGARMVVLGLPMLHARGRDRLVARYELIETEDFAEIDARVGQAHALYTYPPLRVTRETIARAPHLRIVAAAGSGVDHIDVDAATEAGVVVTHAVGASAGATAVAEHIVGHMLCVAKRLPLLDRELRAGNFDIRWDNRFDEISGRTLCIVGFGAIGAEVARICKHGFGMRVIAVTRTGARPGDPNVDDVMTLHDGLAAADIVSVNTPLTPQTRRLLGRGELALMKRTAILIDTSRGGVIDGPALYDALCNGRLAGAGLDVFDPEPPPAGFALFTLPNVVVSPHCAGTTRQSYERLAIAGAAAIDDALCGICPAGIVHATAWAGSRAAQLAGND